MLDEYSYIFSIFFSMIFRYFLLVSMSKTMQLNGRAYSFVDAC